uniref:epsin-2-like n=1 Tax=Styela clava TaxID=7725 RepID=UPI00193A897A|nr:epsin-2-like [Styela clava]
MSVRRNFMNVVRNYTEAEVKVREATSNDAWGPSSSLMSEIADMTYNVIAFSEIMSMIWKRVNDHGKNWRHVYKALTLLDYLIKTGSERVAQQCKENIFAIQTLKDFQFLDRDGKDQGLNVREKSKQLVLLLKDEDRLKTERARAIKAKERFAQATTGIGSDRQISYGHGSSTPQTHRTPETRHTALTSSPVSTELEQARPQTAGEEELQLQLALAMSKEEAEQDKKVDDSDDLRLKMALNKSVENAKPAVAPTSNNQSSLLDLTNAAAQLNDPWGRNQAAAAASPIAQPAVDPFGLPVATPQPQQPADPWGPAPEMSRPEIQSIPKDPWGVTPPVVVDSIDPWGGGNQQPQIKVQGGDSWSSPNTVVAQPAVSNGFDPFASLATSSIQPTQNTTGVQNLMDEFDTLGLASVNINSTDLKPKKSANDFLGEAADLVNLDSLVTPAPSNKAVSNPFTSSAMPRGPAPSYQFPQPTPQPSINQIRGGPSLRPTLGTTVPPASLMGAPTMVTPMPPYGMQTNPMAMPGYGVPSPNPMATYGMTGMAPGGMMANNSLAMQPNMGMGMQPQMTQDNKANPFML